MTSLAKNFYYPVVLESICYRLRAKRLINEGNTTGGLRKIWTGHAIIFSLKHVFRSLPRHCFQAMSVRNAYLHGCIVSMVYVL